MIKIEFNSSKKLSNLTTTGLKIVTSVQAHKINEERILNPCMSTLLMYIIVEEEKREGVKNFTLFS